MDFKSHENRVIRLDNADFCAHRYIEIQRETKKPVSRHSFERSAFLNAIGSTVPRVEVLSWFSALYKTFNPELLPNCTEANCATKDGKTCCNRDHLGYILGVVEYSI